MSENSSPEDLALQEIPEVWFERGRRSAFIPAWLGGLAVGYTLKYFGPEVSPYFEAVTGVSAVVGASLLDRKSSRDLLGSIETGQQNDISYGYVEANEFVGSVESREDFIRSTRSPKILGMEAAFAGVACLGWPFAAPIAAIRGIAAANNSRKARRINKAVEYAHDMR